MSESDTAHGALEFGLLGPFEASYDGAPLVLGGRQQRAVLAMLVCDAGHPVSTERLIDGVWGEPAPAGSVTSVQSYVFHLRQLLEPDRPRGTPGTVLVTVAGGYRLEVNRRSVDANRFEQLVAAGDEAMREGSPGGAATAYTAAEGLWRGDVLADLSDYEFAAPVRGRLEELRVSALQSRMQAELDLGHHEGAAAELGTLIAEHPLRERFHALRILALYRSGRQSDALAAYRELRSVLDSELGIEPSPPLQQLNNQVLQQDPALDWIPPEPQDPATPATPPPASEPPARPVARAGRHRRRLLVLAVAAAAFALAGSAMLLPTGDAPSASARVAANSVSELDASGSVIASVPVRTNPLGLAAGAGAIWVVNGSDDTVSKINPSTHSVEQIVPVGHDPRALAITDDDVWVTNFADGTVTRISISNGSPVDEVDVGTSPDAIATGPAGLWVANSGDNTIQRIDTRTGTPGAAVRVGAGPDGLAVDETSVWVANGRDGSVTRIDASSGSPMSPPIQVGSGPRGIVRAGDDVWVADELSQSVSRIPVTSSTAETFPVGDGPTSVAVLGGSVWLAETYSGDLVRIDRETLERHRVDIKSAVHGVAVVGGHLWVASGAFASTAHLGGTLTVAAGELPGHFSVFDPARIYDTTSLPPMRVVYDGLLAYHYSSADPQVLVPDLATAVPEPTDSGLSYIFNLRPGIRYSTGDEVRPSDFVRGVERALLAQGGGRADFYAGIVGGRWCMKHRVCDLSQGVVADDASGRVTFHLTRPDPEFLYKLTLLVVPTPTGTPMGELTSPLPGTGPYQISSYEKDTALTLSRNRYFHQWSAPAQPAGFLDTITWLKVENARAAADAVRDGDADLAELTPLGEYGKATGALVDDLGVEAPNRLHPTPMQATDFGVLNSSIPPFDDVRARRAVNYALDRRKAAKPLGGDPVARVTCQLLPPTMPGYQPYCPYTTGPHNGKYRGPDLGKARDLVRRSGTKGMEVVVTDVVGDPYPPLDSVFVDVLRSIGYRARLRELPETPENVDFLFDPKSGIQVQSGGWIADYPLPSNFYWLLSCAEVAPGNYTFVHCDKGLDARAAAAADLLQSDAAAAVPVWADIDHEIVDQGLLVPVDNKVDWWLTSDRVSNYLTGLQAIGPLLSQLWVR